MDSDRKSFDILWKSMGSENHSFDSSVDLIHQRQERPRIPLITSCGNQAMDIDRGSGIHCCQLAVSQMRCKHDTSNASRNSGDQKRWMLIKCQALNVGCGMDVEQ